MSLVGMQVSSSSVKYLFNLLAALATIFGVKPCETPCRRAMAHVHLIHVNKKPSYSVVSAFGTLWSTRNIAMFVRVPATPS